MVSTGPQRKEQKGCLLLTREYLKPPMQDSDMRLEERAQGETSDRAKRPRIHSQRTRQSYRTGPAVTPAGHKQKISGERRCWCQAAWQNQVVGGENDLKALTKLEYLTSEGNLG